MRRWLARWLVWLSGQAARVKTRQRHYRLISTDPWLVDEVGEVTWSSWRFSYRLLSWAMHLDWEHWPHWGLQHDGCLAGPHEVCTVCGGVICDWDDDDD